MASSRFLHRLNAREVRCFNCFFSRKASHQLFQACDITCVLSQHQIRTVAHAVMRQSSHLKAQKATLTRLIHRKATFVTMNRKRLILATSAFHVLQAIPKARFLHICTAFNALRLRSTSPCHLPIPMASSRFLHMLNVREVRCLNRFCSRWSAHQLFQACDVTCVFPQNQIRAASHHVIRRTSFLSKGINTHLVPPHAQRP